ncbi:MAG: hypothetical protein AAF389_13535 [Gemmatimonadota bacterium]
MTVSKQFLAVTGVAGVVAGVFTVGIVVLPNFYPVPIGPDEQLALLSNPFYQTRQWLSFLNVIAVLVSGWGLAAHRLRHSPGAASSAVLFLGIYTVTELLGRSVMIFARDARWIPAGDADLFVRGLDDVWRSWFFVILVSYAAAVFLLGWAARGGRRLQRAVSWSLFAAAGLAAWTLVARWIPELRPSASLLYPLIQPTSRFLLGVFLVDEARRRAD